MIRSFEEMSMNAWPALQTELYDGWIMRFADGYTKRSNSINPIYPSLLDLEKKIAVCESIYRSRNIPVIFKLTSDPAQSRLDGLLGQRGYVRIDETSFRLLDLRDYQGSIPEGIGVDSRLDDSWFGNFFRISETNEEAVQLTARRLLGNVRGEVLGISKTVNGEVVGSGLGVIERGFVGVFDVIVDKPRRGMGYGHDILNGILSVAKEKQVETSYLQVVAGNTVAENLYEELGYREIYSYWYRVKGV